MDPFIFCCLCDTGDAHSSSGSFVAVWRKGRHRDLPQICSSGLSSATHTVSTAWPGLGLPVCLPLGKADPTR